MRCAVDNIRTYLTSVCAKGSSSIFLGFMVEEAFLWIVLERNFAGLGFKVIKINEGNDIIISGSSRFSLKHLRSKNA